MAVSITKTTEAVETPVKPLKERIETPVKVKTGKEVILEVLGRAADDSKFLAQLADDPKLALAPYYALTSEERAALISGDIKQIESWVGKLDKRLATWLWCRLSQEKW